MHYQWDWPILLKPGGDKTARVTGRSRGTWAAHNGVLALWQCARSGTVHAVASSFAFHRWFTATHRSPRAQPMRHHLFFQRKESCAVAASYAVLNDGHRSISRLSARSTPTHADRCLSSIPRNGSPSTSGRGWSRWNNWRRGWFSASNPSHRGLVTMEGRFEHDPNMTQDRPETVVPQSLTRFGAILCIEKHQISCFRYLSNTHFVRDFLPKCMWNACKNKARAN